MKKIIKFLGYKKRTNMKELLVIMCVFVATSIIFTKIDLTAGYSFSTGIAFLMILIFRLFHFIKEAN